MNLRKMIIEPADGPNNEFIEKLYVKNYPEWFINHL